MTTQQSIHNPVAVLPGDGVGTASIGAAGTPALHPHLHRPLLHITDLDPGLTDKELASSIFEKCLPVRLSITRDVAPGMRAYGTVEFQSMDKAERALATVRGVRLSISPDESNPIPAAKTRLVKQLPVGTEDADIFDLFRPFGPVAKAMRILANPAGQHTGFRGMATVDFYSEDDAQRAQDELHCTDFRGKTISVSVDTVVRKGGSGEFSAAAAPFVPGAGAGRMSAAAPAFAPVYASPSGGSEASMYAAAAASPAANHQQAGPMISFPGSNLQYSTSAAAYIDPCNLFCKNLDPSLTSSDLFNTFREFGTIVSARIMRDEEGNSREFGFVSFKQAHEASRALQARNGFRLGTKAMVVSFHEPKRLREQKMAMRLGSGTNTQIALPSTSRDASPASPAPSDPATRRSPSGSPHLSDTSAVPGRREGRSGNESYYATGPDGSQRVDLDRVAAMAPARRRDVLALEFGRRIKSLPDVLASEIDPLVEGLVSMDVHDAVGALNDPHSLMQRVVELRERLDPVPKLPRPAVSAAGLAPPAAPNSNNGDAASTVSTAPAGARERERLLRAVTTTMAVGSPVEDVTDMLCSLSKKDRALCLFNPEFLRSKIEEAQGILDLSDGGDGQDVIPEAPATGAGAGSDRRASVAGGETTPTVHSLSSLAKLPAVEILKLIQTPSVAGSAGLPVPKADPEVVASTDSFIDGLHGKPVNDQKQKLGDQLFKKVRGFGFKGAPKLTITLLDTEDLRSLAHLMNSYPEVLREKVSALASTSK